MEGGNGRNAKRGGMAGVDWWGTSFGRAKLARNRVRCYTINVRGGESAKGTKSDLQNFKP